MTDIHFLPSLVGYFQSWLTMSFILASLKSTYFLANMQFLPPLSLLASAQTLESRYFLYVQRWQWFCTTLLHQKSFPKQPEKKDQARTASDSLLGQSRLQHGQVFPEDAPSAISMCANNSKTLLNYSILLTSRSQSTLKWQHCYLLFIGRNYQSPGNLGVIIQPRTEEKTQEFPSHVSSP